MSTQTASIGTAIRLRRQEIGLTQEELAERMGDGIRQSDISRLERDRIQMPRPARFLAIAAALELEPGDLLQRAGWAGADGEPSRRDLPEVDRDSLAALGDGPARSDDAQHDEDVQRLSRALHQARVVQSQFINIAHRYEQTAAYWRRHFGIAVDRR